MRFPFSQSVTRLRAATATDPYSATSTRKDWANPSTSILSGVWVSQSSSTLAPDATRAEVTTSKSLYCPPGFDIRVGDRIDTGSEVYTVIAVPSADVNPFTGWQPVQEVPLELVEG